MQEIEPLFLNLCPLWRGIAQMFLIHILLSHAGMFRQARSLGHLLVSFLALLVGLTSEELREHRSTSARNATVPN